MVSNSKTLSVQKKEHIKKAITPVSPFFLPDNINFISFTLICFIIDEIVDVSDGDAIIMAQKLANELGLAVGISSGANFIGALKIQNELGNDAIVTTVFSDDNKKYISTDLMKVEPLKDEYYSKDIELLEYDVFKRVCKTCCDPFGCTQKNKFSFD